MPNQKNVVPEENFILKLKEVVRDNGDESILNEKIDYQLSDIIHNFIKDEKHGLINYDKNLHDQYYRRNTFPVVKTIKRAFFYEKKSASPDLINICGYFIYKEAWAEERKKYKFIESSIQKESNSTFEAENIVATKDITAKVKQKNSTKTKIKDWNAGGKINIDIDQE